MCLQGEGERNNTVPSNLTEKKWYVEDSPNVSSVEELKDTPVLRKKKPYKVHRGDEINFDEISEAVEKLAAHYAGLPEFAGSTFNVVRDGPPSVSLPLKPDLKPTNKRANMILLYVLMPLNHRASFYLPGC